MPVPRQSRSGHLRLVEVRRENLPPIVSDSSARQEFERLTQRLVDVAIELVDLVDGDPDLEPDEPIEDDDGL